jgi:hypothetical protein
MVVLEGVGLFWDVPGSSGTLKWWAGVNPILLAEPFSR